MAPECLFMVYGCPLYALTTTPQVCYPLHLICYLVVVLFSAVAYIVFFLYPPCIPGHGAFRGGIRVFYFNFVFNGE